MAFILPFGEAHQAWRTGSKAAHLSALYAAGFSVPEGFAVTTDALDHFLEANGIAAQAQEICAVLDDSDPNR